MFLKEDVVATPDLSATLTATCAVATPVLSVTLVANRAVYHRHPPHRPLAVFGKKLLSLCTRAPRRRFDPRFLHGFDHVRLDFGHYSTKGLSSA